MSKEIWNQLKEIKSAAHNGCADPNCPCHALRRQPAYPDLSQCSLNKPLWMVIPPEGTHISCPVHGQHFVMGTQVTCSTTFGPTWRSEARL